MAEAVEWEKSRTPGVYSRVGPRGKHWRHVYRDGTGRQVACHKCPRLKDAEDHQRRMMSDRPEDVAAGRIALRAVYEKMVAAHEAAGEPYAPATLALHEQAWKHLAHLADTDLGRISSSAISSALKAIPGPAIRDKTRKMLSTTFAYAVSERYLTTNPVRQDRKRTTRAAKMRHRTAVAELRVLGEDELARLVGAMDERYRALVELMAYVGLRPGEAVALTVGKFDPMQRTLLVDTSLSGFTKTGEPRSLVLPAVVAEMLTEHLARFSDPADPTAPMFPRQDGTGITTKNAYDAFARRHFQAAAKRADVNHGLSPNDLRHFAAAHAIHHGATVLQVSKMLGHARPSITLDVYAYLFADSLDELAENLDGAIREVRAQRPKLAEVIRL
jgi:integrase